MSSLIPDAEKLALGNVFNDIHDTFSRPVIVWKIPDRVVVSSDVNYNFLYHEQDQSLEVNYIPVSGIFNCRIQWQDPSKMLGWPEIKEEVRGNICRIKAKQDMVDFMSNHEKIEIDGRPVQSLGTNKPHGLFKNDFYTMFFRESE